MASPAPASASAVASARVSANNATPALEAAGVGNAARWAREVVEYRPYPTDEPNLSKLRKALVKYNPAPGVTDAIVGALSLP